MLTATYSLVTIAAEQERVRSILRRVQQYLQTTWDGLQHIDFGFLDTAFGKLLQLDKYCQSRKIEMYLIPALRRASKEADALIIELELLTAKSADTLRSVGEQLASTFDLSSVKVNEICHAMELYCGNVAIRLEKEDKELFPLAQRLFSVDDWFSIAAQFLADGASFDEGQRYSTMRSPAAMQDSSRAHMHGCMPTGQ